MWHDLYLFTRGNEVWVGCDADECEDWEQRLEFDDHTDSVVKVSWLYNCLEDDHNEAVREVASR